MNPTHAIAVQLQLFANPPDKKLSGLSISNYFALPVAVSGAHKRLQQLEAWQPKMDAALHEQRAASALQSDTCSRPSTSTSSSSLAFFGRSRGLATTCSQTYSRLGYVSPSYADKHATSHGIIGMSGYLSVPHLTLTPTIPNALGERVLAAAAAGPGKGQQRPNPRGASSSARQYRRLSQKDLHYLKDNEERNQQVSCPSQDWHAPCRPGTVASGCNAHSSLLHLVCMFRCSSNG